MTRPIQPVPDRNAEASLNLLLKAQAGDAEALEALLSRYLPRLRHWASGRLPRGVGTTLDTADLVQDAVISALRHVHALEIRTEGALQVYLRRSVNDRIVDLSRRAARGPSPVECPAGAAAGETSPLEAAVGAQALESYENALATLREEERQAIVLRVELGLDYSEIAAQLGKPSAAVARATVTHAIARLAGEMRRPG